MNAQLIKPDGSVVDVIPEGKTFSLSELQSFVDGCIEVLVLPNGNHLYLNGDGKYQDLLPNLVATEMVADIISPIDFVVGNVITGPASLFEDEDSDEE